MRWERLAVIRTLLLTLAGLACLVVGALLLAEWAGWLTAGAALLVLEWLTRPEERTR